MAKEYIEERSGGLYVAGTRVSLASVVYKFREGASPETILQDLPTLKSLVNVYGAITHCLENPDRIEEYLKVEKEKWEFRKSADPLPPGLIERLQRVRQ